MILKRTIAAGAAVLAIAGAARAAVPAGGGVVGALAPRAKLTDFQCMPAFDPLGRGVSVTAVMRPIPGTVRMAMKTDLLAKRSVAGNWHAVPGANLGSWKFPKPPTLGQESGDVWNLTHQVSGRGISAPAVYRFRVTFRWTARHGIVLKRLVRYSPTCYQPELRPDLMVVPPIIVNTTTDPTTDAYVATIRNRGASGAGPFQVLFTDGSAPAQTVTVSFLGSHQSVREHFQGPVCTTANAPTVTVDPTGQVADYNRTNNALTATCPG